MTDDTDKGETQYQADVPAQQQRDRRGGPDAEPWQQDTAAGMEDLLDRLLQTASQAGDVSIADMLAATGRRSFGPTLLVAGLVVFSPLSGIPGLPSVVAALVVLIAAQMLFGHRHFWLPQWVLKWKVSAALLQRAIRIFRPVARVMDRLTRTRLSILTGGLAQYPIAVLCLLIALTMPPLELVPFANSLAGAALSAFGLALVTDDGVLALIAVAFCATGIGLIVWQMLQLT